LLVSQAHRAVAAYICLVSSVSVNVHCFTQSLVQNLSIQHVQTTLIHPLYSINK